MTRSDSNGIEFHPTLDELAILATEYLDVACLKAFHSTELPKVDSIVMVELRPNPRLRTIESILGRRRMDRIRMSVLGAWVDLWGNAHDLCRAHGVDKAEDIDERLLADLWGALSTNKLLGGV